LSSPSFGTVCYDGPDFYGNRPGSSKSANRINEHRRRKLDYSEYGGAHLLGIDGICIIGHGRSDPNAVKNAVRVAKELVTKRVKERIQQGLSRAKPGLDGI
jgi:glycerol-3-phosphate acyltransferase PlsX